ncbi:hypothetical protein SprV_0200701900 [Sparganum proliferum]
MAGPDAGHRRSGADGNHQHLRYAGTTTTTLERPPRTDGPREATQTTLLWRCRDGLTSTWRPRLALQGYSQNLPELPADQPGKLGRPLPGPTYVEENSEDSAAIFEANRITAAKAKRETRKYQVSPPSPHSANVQPPPKCSRCQRTFRTQTGLVGHFRTKCSTRTALNVVSPSTSPSAPTPSTNMTAIPNHHYYPPPSPPSQHLPL